MKNNGRKTVDFASSEAWSAINLQKQKSRLSRKFIFFIALALIFGASLGLTQSVKASEALTVTGIQSVLQGEPQALKSQQTTQSSQQDEAVSALSGFAQQIGSPAVQANRQFNDQALATLQDFAQRLGTAQPQSIKDLPQTARAKTLLEFLQQGGSAPATSQKATAPGRAAQPVRAPIDATYVDGKVCLTCHASHAAEFEKTLMGRIGKTQKGKFECQNCHGPGSAHVKAGGGRGVGGIISFRPNDSSRTAEENNGICLNCHEKGDRTLWQGSTHQTRGLMCTNCHTVMKDVSRKHQLKTKSEPDTCFQCHKDIRSKMSRSEHMPVREGKMECTNCHNPHGSYNDKLLKEATVNDTCFQCHADKRGPFLWEHAPVVESCLNCHDPHGSINDNMLQVSRPRLCQRCHNAANYHPANPRGPSTLYTVNSSCVNCHSQIHGSNSPAGQRFIR